MCKKFRFDHPNKFYIHNLAAVQENDTHKLLCDFDVDGSSIFDRQNRPYNNNNNNNNKRTCKIVDLAVPSDHRIKLKENEKKSKYLDLAKELKKYGTRR